jgi:ribosomal protein L3 glutamine methyltransferase
MNNDVIGSLVTLRDFLRYAVSRFNEAELIFGHGTDNAFDEAAFLVLEALSLPIDNLEPFLDAKLLTPERQRLAELIEERVTTRKPLPYLLNKAYIQGVPFYVDERVIVPRSYIGEILAGDMLTGQTDSLIPEPHSVGSVLDLCTGSGCLAILAAKLFGTASVVAADLSKDALDVARINVDRHELADRIELVEGDLLEPLKNRKFDLILANPPYVARAEVEAFGAEYRAEPQMAHISGPDGLVITRRILNAAPDHLTDAGILVCEIGTGRHILEVEFPHLPFLWLDTDFSEGEVFALAKGDFENQAVNADV